MPGSLGLIWSLIKSLRYLLPFLNEVTDEKDAINDKDLIRIRELKSILRSAAWRIIYLFISAFVLFFGVIPTYTKNATLQVELDKTTSRVIRLTNDLSVKDNDIRKLRDQVTNLEMEVKVSEKDYKRLFDSLTLCRNDLTEYRGRLVETTQPIQKGISSPRTEPTKPSIRTLDDSTRSRLKALSEGE